MIESPPASNPNVKYIQNGGVAGDASGNIWTSYVTDIQTGSGGSYDISKKFSPTGHLLSIFTFDYNGIFHVLNMYSSASRTPTLEAIYKSRRSHGTSPSLARRVAGDE